MFKINVVAGTKAYCYFQSCIVYLNVSQGLLCNSFEIGFIHGQAQSISEKCMSNFNYNISLFMFSGISVPTVCWTISNFMASFKKNNRGQCCTAWIVLIFTVCMEITCGKIVFHHFSLITISAIDLIIFK